MKLRRWPEDGEDGAVAGEGNDWLGPENGDQDMSAIKIRCCGDF